MSDSNGAFHSLESFRGSYVLVHFWATWCPPCVEEFPSLDSFNRKMKSHPITVVAISADDSWQPISDFWMKLGRTPTFLVLLDAKKEMANLWGVSKFPETFLLDPDGNIQKKWTGAVPWSSETAMSEIRNLTTKVK